MLRFGLAGFRLTFGVGDQAGELVVARSHWEGLLWISSRSHWEGPLRISGRGSPGMNGAYQK